MQRTPTQMWASTTDCCKYTNKPIQVIPVRNLELIGHDSDSNPISEPSSNVTRTTKTYTSTGNIAGRQPSASRELHFDSPLPAGTTTKTTTTVRQSRSRQRSPATETQTHVTRDVSYDSDPTVDNLQSTSSTINRSYNTNSYRSSSRGGAPAEHVPQQLVPYNEFVDELDAGSLPAELSGLPLDGGLLPGPGTKVTTTVCEKYIFLAFFLAFYKSVQIMKRICRKVSQFNFVTENVYKSAKYK